MKGSKKVPRTGELNLTPLIDCVVILVSFLLLVTEFSRQNEFGDIQLPDIKQSGIVENPDPKRLVLMIKQDGAIYISGEAVPEAKAKQELAVEARISREAGNALSNRLVLVGADQRTKWEHVQRIVNWCVDPNIRIWRLAFATQPGEPGTKAPPK